MCDEIAVLLCCVDHILTSITTQSSQEGGGNIRGVKQDKVSLIMHYLIRL